MGLPAAPLPVVGRVGNPAGHPPGPRGDDAGDQEGRDQPPFPTRRCFRTHSITSQRTATETDRTAWGPEESGPHWCTGRRKKCYPGQLASRTGLLAPWPALLIKSSFFRLSEHPTLPLATEFRGRRVSAGTTNL